MNLANALTTGRIFIIPFFLFFFFADFPNHYFWAGVLFVCSGLTDFLDGYIARSRNLTTKLGRLLDPLADKLSMISAFISLAIAQILPLWIIMIILIREVTILSGSIFVYFTGHDIIFPNRGGKLATFCLYATAAASILGVQFLDSFFLALAIPLTLLSALDYFINAYRHYFEKQG